MLRQQFECTTRVSMRMSLPNQEKQIQVKCQIRLCRIKVLVHTAFREAASYWNTEKESSKQGTALKEAIGRYSLFLADHDYRLLSSVILRHELFIGWN